MTIQWVFNGKYWDGYLGQYNLYTVATDGKKWYCQGATMPAMSTVCKDEWAAKSMAESNAVKFVADIKAVL